MKIEIVGIAGFQELANRIALLAAIAGYTTIVWDTNQVSLESAIKALKKSIDKEIDAGTLAKGKKETILAQIIFSTDLNIMKKCGLVIEATAEDIQLKKTIFADLSHIVAEKTILATTTSCFSVTEISQPVRNTERAIGLHFVESPQGTMLVEIINTERTSQESISLALDFCTKIGTEAVVSRDSPGFIVNYLFAPYMNQALDACDHGLASKGDLDLALRMGLGYPKGPLELIEHIGKEKYLHLTSVLYQRLLDPRFAPPAILKRMVDGEESKR